MNVVKEALMYLMALVESLLALMTSIVDYLWTFCAGTGLESAKFQGGEGSVDRKLAVKALRPAVLYLPPT